MAPKLRKYLKNIPKTHNYKQLTYPRYEHTGDAEEAISISCWRIFYGFHSFLGGGKLSMIAAEYNELSTS